MAIAVLLIRGAGGLAAAPSTTIERVGGGQGDDAVSAAAERFARLYLEDPSPADLAPYLAAGARIGAGRPPSTRGAEVAQADVVDIAEVGDGRLVVTVSCELRDARTLELAVPFVRHGPGEVAVLGAPSIVATPAPVRSANWSASSCRPTSPPPGARSSPTCWPRAPRSYRSAARSNSKASDAPGSSATPKGRIATSSSPPG